MLNLSGNNKGISLVEVMIAIFLLAVGILALLAMQPMSWKTAGKSNLLGMAAGILHQELTNNELDIMRLTSTQTPATGTSSTTVYASGEAALQTDDTAFTVQTTTTDNGDDSWTVKVVVTGPDNNSISESIIATRQQPFSP